MLFHRSPYRYSKRSAAKKCGLRVEQLEKREVPALGLPIHLDFGTPTSPVAPGYVGVSPVASYSTSLGYGWSGSSITAYDRGTSDPLIRDFNAGDNGTFLVDVPNGTYNVTLTLGDPTQAHSNISVYLEGQKVASGLSTQAGQVIAPTYQVAVSDGQLTLQLYAKRSRNTFPLDALDIVPLVTSPPPIANAGPDQTTSEGTQVQFSGSASGGTAPLSYSWNFGDGATATGTLTPTHTYADNGTYTVTLTVTDANKLTGQDTAVVTVNNMAPANVNLAISTASINEGSSLALGGSFTDPGTLDTHTVVINWGDGSANSTVNLAAGILSFSSISHQYTDNPAGQPTGSYAISVTVTDKDGGQATASSAVQVNNVAPTANAGGPYSGTVGTAIAFTDSATDPSPVDTAAGFTYSWNFGDGGTGTGASVSHTYAGVGTYAVTVTATDKDGGANTATTTATVSSVPAPLVANAGPDVTTNEGTQVQFSGSASGGTAPLSYSWNFGDGAAASGTLTPTHTYADNGTYTVTLTVTDVSKLAGQDTAVVTVNNVAPSNVSLALSATSINENGLVSLSGSFTDPGTVDTHTVGVNWGDGSAKSSVNLAAGVLSFSSISHQYTDNPTGQPTGSYTISVTVTDKDSGQGTASTAVQVKNVAPTANAGGPYSGTVGTAIAFTGSATDPSSVDTTAGFTYSWNFGDGATGSGSNASHTYSTAGTFTATLTATDKDGGSASATTSVTVSSTSTSVTFAAFGDYGDGPNSMEPAVASLVHSWNPDFIVTTGDNNYLLPLSFSTYDQAVGQYYHDFISPYTGSYGAGATTNRFWPSLGNHDWGDTYPNPTGADPYLNYFSMLPGNRRYYTVRQGPVQLFAIDGDDNEPDGNSSTSVQAQWLKSQLAASTAPWKIVYDHYPPYSSGSNHGSDSTMQWPYQAWGATAFFSGHDHEYERLLEGNNFPYFVVGTGGASLYSFATPLPGSQVRDSSDWGALKVTASDTQITFQFITTTGKIIDTYSLTKSGAPAAPSGLTGTGMSASEIDTAWTNNASNATSIKVERSPDGTNFTQVAALGGTVTSYKDTGLNASTKYYYRVRASNSAGDSAYTNVANATTAAAVNGSPANLLLTLSATAINEGNSVNLGGSFTDAVTGITHQVAINWGDGSATTSVNLAAGVLSFSNVSHTYADNPTGQPNGKFTISVTVTAGTGQTTASTSVQVNNVAPTANAGGPYSATVGTALTFNGSATDPSSVDTSAGLTFSWNFGDASTGSGAKPSHTYSTAGTYTATLTASDKDGGSSSATATVTVSATSTITLVTDPNKVFSMPVVNKVGYLGTFTDPTFGTPITRIAADPGLSVANVSGGIWSSDARHNYNTVEPWNSDGSLIWIENRTDDGGTPDQLYLDGNTYAVKFGTPSNMPGGGGYDQRWNPSPLHPNEVVIAGGGTNKFYWFDVVKNTVTRSWTLPISITYIGNTDGKLSADGRFVALGDGTHVFVVDMDPQSPYSPYPNQRIGPVFDLSTLGFSKFSVDGYSVSASGKYVVVHYNDVGSSSGDFEEVFDVDPTTLALTPRPMPTSYSGCLNNPSKGFVYNLGHEDMAVNPYDNNEDVIVGQEHCGNVGKTISGVKTVNGDGIGHVVMVRLRDGAVTSLTDPGGGSVASEAYASHISTRNVNRPGWAYVSYYPASGARYSMEVIAVKMDGTGTVERYAHHHSDFENFTGTTSTYQSKDSDYNYRSEPHQVPSPDGQRIIFASNWVYQGNGGQGIEDYVIDLRGTNLSKTATSTSLSTATTIASPSVLVSSSGSSTDLGALNTRPVASDSVNGSAGTGTTTAPSSSSGSVSTLASERRRSAADMSAIDAYFASLAGSRSNRESAGNSLSSIGHPLWDWDEKDLFSDM